MKTRERKMILGTRSLRRKDTVEQNIIKQKGFGVVRQRVSAAMGQMVSLKNICSKHGYL